MCNINTASCLASDHNNCFKQRATLGICCSQSSSVVLTTPCKVEQDHASTASVGGVKFLLWTPAQRKRVSMLFLPMFYLFIFLWPPYSPTLVNGSSWKFYTWWTLNVIREVTTWIFSWSFLNYIVGQKVTKFGVFSDPTRKLSALTPECGRIL